MNIKLLHRLLILMKEKKLRSLRAVPAGYEKHVFTKQVLFNSPHDNSRIFNKIDIVLKTSNTPLYRCSIFRFFS